MMAKSNIVPTKKGKASLKKSKKKLSFKDALKRIRRFFKEVISELKKVTWPTKKILISYTVAVVIFVVIGMVVVFGIDNVTVRLFGYLQ